jgi:hypothetical protein
VRQADASQAASFADALPADVLMLCGIFGNVSDQDIERTIAVAPLLCAAGATVLWTRNRRAPDRTPWIRALFAAAGFDEVTFDPVHTHGFMGVGVNRLRQAGAPGAAGGAGGAGAAGGTLPPGPLFTFRTEQAASRRPPDITR